MAFATYKDIVSGSSGSSRGSKISTYQDIKKSITPAQFEENKKRLQETNEEDDRNCEESEDEEKKTSGAERFDGEYVS